MSAVQETLLTGGCLQTESNRYCDLRRVVSYPIGRWRQKSTGPRWSMEQPMAFVRGTHLPLQPIDRCPEYQLTIRSCRCVDQVSILGPRLFRPVLLPAELSTHWERERVAERLT